MGSRILKVRPAGTQGWWVSEEPIWGRGFANLTSVQANPSTSGGCAIDLRHISNPPLTKGLASVDVSQN